MVLRADKERVQALVAETVTLLCKNGLTFKTEFCIEALVGITLDQDNEFHFSIKQTVKSDRALEEEEEQQQREEEEAAEAEISAVQDSKKPLEVLVHSRKSAGAGRRKVALEAVSGASPATTVSGGEVAEDLPSLTFETGEGSGDYWSSVAGHEGGHTPNNRGAKRKSSAAHAEYAQHKRSQVNRNSTPDAEGHSDTNSDLVVIKDEPADDDDDATGYSYDDTGNSGQYDASVFRNIASGDSRVEQVSMQAAGGVPWDQIASFSGDAGTAVGPDGQPLDPQQDDLPSLMAALPCFNTTRPGPWQPSPGRSYHQSPDFYTHKDLAKKILLHKRHRMTPREFQKACSSIRRPVIDQVRGVMVTLGEEGVATCESMVLGGKIVKNVFVKKPPEEIADRLKDYDITLEEYSEAYASSLETGSVRSALAGALNNLGASDPGSVPDPGV